MGDGLIERVGTARFEPGCWQGLRQPAMLVTLRFTRPEVNAIALRRFDALLAQVQSPEVSALLVSIIDPAVLRHPLLGRLCRMALGALNAMGMPVLGGCSALRTAPQAAAPWTVGLPAIAQDVHAPQEAFDGACEVMNELADGRDVLAAAIRAGIQQLAARFRAQAPAGVNTLRFLEAAHEIDIPWRHVANNVYQFGWGSRSRWLDSSFTDQTSNISARLARDKVACARVLRDAGLPVPRHQRVSRAEDAVQVAQALGYPVVVKPANLDGGQGVLAGLRDGEAVAKAFTAAAGLSNDVLVEEFIDGNDYRVRVCTGLAFGAVIRRPAAVEGDGVRSVRTLIDDINRHRASLPHPLDPDVEEGTSPIEVDDEVQQWLATQGLDLDSVLAPGQRVRLRGAANTSLGGTTREVTREVHPDNMALAVQAVAALRLDVAGVDLLLPDITRSWKETGGAICEVNSQPQFSSTPAHRQVLERLVRGDGRIPVVGVLQACLPSQLLDSVAARLAHEGLRVRQAADRLQCQQALGGADVDAVIWHMAGWPSPGTAWPVDRLDLLILPSLPPTGAVPAPVRLGEVWELGASPQPQAMAERLFSRLRAACIRPS